MLRCVRCEAENIDEAQFCDECGNSFSAGGAVAAVAAEKRQSGRLTMTDIEANTEFEPAALNSADPAEWQANGDNGSRATQLNSEQLNEKKSFVSSPAFAHARLIIERGGNFGKEFILSENEINIGRWDADNGVFPDVDLDADDPEAKVSRRHACIVRHGSQYLIEDLGSTNGTFVNRGRRLLPGNRQQINDNDEIIVGKTFLRFQIIR